MNTHVSTAIVLRIKEFGESDLLISFFTADKGRLKGVAKGARRSKKRFSNCLDLFCLANLEYDLKRKGDLHFLHSGKLLDAFPGLRSDFYSLSLASYMTELTEILFPVAVVDEKMFALLKESFFAISEGKQGDMVRTFFEARAMALGGYGIDLDICCSCKRPYTGRGDAVFEPRKGRIACLNCKQGSKLTPRFGPGSVNGLKMMQLSELKGIETLRLTDEMIQEIKPVNKLHIEYRVGKRLKSARFLE
jgi:DNA repair protein RecO (recombination protein O)